MIIPRTVHLAPGALPAAGAFTTQDAFDIPAGAKILACYVTYTRGAAGGFPTFRALVGNGSDEVRTVVIDSASFAVVDPNGTYDVDLEQINGPTPADGAAIGYVLRFCVDGGYTTFRLTAAEAGAVGTPGAIAITLTGSN